MKSSIFSSKHQNNCIAVNIWKQNLSTRFMFVGKMVTDLKRYSYLTIRKKELSQLILWKIFRMYLYYNFVNLDN